MTYLDEHKYAIVIREAPYPWGPWGAPFSIAEGLNYPTLYGAYMDTGFVENDGESIYYIMTQFNQYNTYWMKTTILKSGSDPLCGDGTCNGDETCDSCPVDCGQCPECGDGTCNGDETCDSCPVDCGQCPECALTGESCDTNDDCCSNNCKGKPGSKLCR